MKILNLNDEKADFSALGGKASGLNRLFKLGLNVPSGFVICNLTEESDLSEAVKYYQSSGLKKVAVRSSASNEDGLDFSAAGQYETFLNIEGEKAFEDAVRLCVKSISSKTAQSYMANFHNALPVSMNVVVQEMVSPVCAGVVFSKSPQDNKSILIEAVEGLGEGLVSGAKSATQFVLSRELDNTALEKRASEISNQLLNKEQIIELYNTALRLEKELNCPQDLEFAVDENNKLAWLQTRPITIDDDTDMLHEFDPTYNMDGMTITRCNIGEMLPGAVTPLTISNSLYSIDYGMREMLRISGVVKNRDDLEEYSCALSICNHLFLNLSSLYKMDGLVVGTKAEMIELSLCGKALDTPKNLSKKISLLKRLNNGRKYFGFLLSSKKARKELNELLSSLTVGQNANTVEDLYKDIDAKKWVNDRAMTLHYVTSSHSGAMSSALWQTLDSKYKNSEKSKTVVAELLEGIDNIESVDILRSLRALAREILIKNPSAASLSCNELDEYLQTADQSVLAAYNSFMDKHGHRTIREAEMRNKGWADDKDSFLSYLKTVIASGGKEPTKTVAPNLKKSIKELGFKGAKANILVYLANQARLGVVNREFSKSRIIKIMDIFKKAYSRLANMLFEKGILSDPDLIYFLTHKEIGELVLNNRFALIKSAIKRRRILSEQAGLEFEEVNVSKPQPVEPDLSCAAPGTILTGTPISRGSITAKARVIKNEEDAKLLEKGEIMIASYTDIGWSPYYCLISGLVTEVGSALSHGAVVAREYSLPLIANVNNATRLIKTGDTIIVNAYNGTISII